MENEMKGIEEKIVEKPYKDDVNYDEFNFASCWYVMDDQFKKGYGL